MSRRAPVRELLLGGGLAIAIFACNLGPKGVEPLPPTPPPPPPMDPRVTEITALWSDIRTMRQDAHWESDPSIELIRNPALCPEEAPATCHDTCSLSEHICDNAEAICDLAGQLRGTPSQTWADGKCEDAKNSCREAKKRCACCQKKNGGDDDDAPDANGSW